MKRTIETLVGRAVITSPQIEEISTATKPTTVYVFSGEQGKRDSIVVVAQLSPEFTARLVDRWQELEEQVAQPAVRVPQSFPEALRLAAELAEQNEKLTQENAVMSDELNYVTVDEYRALTHRYFTHGQKIRLAKEAVAVSREEGVQVSKQQRTLHLPSGDKLVGVNVYPRHVLEEAELRLAA